VSLKAKHRPKTILTFSASTNIATSIHLSKKEPQTTLAIDSLSKIAQWRSNTLKAKSLRIILCDFVNTTMGQPNSGRTLRHVALFPQLPFELRLSIWDLALPEWRIVTIDHY
jgi:hypothetical protein